MSAPNVIRPRVREAVLYTLAAGMVSSVGVQHLQVGRKPEVEAIAAHCGRIADAGSAIWLLSGPTGAGKTFLVAVSRSIAHAKRIVTLSADLTFERRLHGTGGEARALFRELVANMATATKPEGGALPAVLERFVTSAREAAQASGVALNVVVSERLKAFRALPGGFDFEKVVASYVRAYDSGDDALLAVAERWLRGELSSRSEARDALDVRTIIDDDNVFEHIELLAAFVRAAGYSGLLVCIDELAEILRIGHAGARKATLNRVLALLNRCHHGNVAGLGYVFGATPQVLMDPSRGFASDPALAGRLAENAFLNGGVSIRHPVIRLMPLDRADLFILLQNIRHVEALGEPAKYLIPDDGIEAFMQAMGRRLGDASFRTPRETVKQFVGLLEAIEREPAAPWQEHLNRMPGAKPGSADADDDTKEDDDGLARVQL